MHGLQYNTELLAPLTGLTGLHELVLGDAEDAPEDLQVVCQLTGLRRLVVGVPESSNDWVKGLLLQLTQLQQLSYPELGDPEIFSSGDSTQGGFFLKVEVSAGLMSLGSTWALAVYLHSAGRMQYICSMQEA
jgi:hypothetical protein